MSNRLRLSFKSKKGKDVMNKEDYIDAINNYWLGECGGENVGLNSEECSTILSFMKEAEYTYGNTKDMSEEVYDRVVEQLADKLVEELFANKLKSMIAQRGIKLGFVASQLGYKAQSYLNSKLNKDSFTRKELLQLKNILKLENDEFMALLSV